MSRAHGSPISDHREEQGTSMSTAIQTPTDTTAAGWAGMTAPSHDLDDVTEEEQALEQGMTFCAVCETWGTVPGSLRCENCFDDKEEDEA